MYMYIHIYAGIEISVPLSLLAPPSSPVSPSTQVGRSSRLDHMTPLKYSYGPCKQDDYQRYMYNVNTLINVPLLLFSQILSGHEGPVSGVVFSPVKSLLASSSWDCTVKLWDVFENKGNVETMKFTTMGKGKGAWHSCHLEDVMYCAKSSNIYFKTTNICLAKYLSFKFIHELISLRIESMCNIVQLEIHVHVYMYIMFCVVIQNG